MKKSYVLQIKTRLGWEAAGLFATLSAAKRYRLQYPERETRIQPVAYRGGAV